MDPKTVKELKQILKKELDPVNEKLDSLTIDMIDVQKKTDAIADIRDMLKGTKAQVDDHEDRITSLEVA